MKFAPSARVALSCFALATSCHKAAVEPPIVGTVARFDLAALTATDDFYGLPFPNDLRVTSTGLNLTGFPNPAGSVLLQSYLSALENSGAPFSTNAPLYVNFSAAIDPATLPTDPLQTLKPSSPVQLIDVDPNFSTAGQFVPLQFQWTPSATHFLAANTLAIAPLAGAPLANGHLFALVITSALHDAAGQPVVADALTRIVLGRWDPTDAAGPAIGLTQPFIRWALGASYPVDQVQLVSVFTTADATDTMLLTRSLLRTGAAPGVTDLGWYGDTPNGAHIFTGALAVQNFQAGAPPYLTPGVDANGDPVGGFVLDDTATPIPQRSEQVRFALTVPKGPPPENGFPIVLYGHETGGSYLSFATDSADDGAAGDTLADDAAALGLASLTMEQVLHGPRNPGCDATSAGYAACVATDFFNFANPYAARDNARQGGADLLQLMLVAQQLQISAAIDPEHIVPTLDPGHIAFLGDSQGGITGAPFVAAEAQLTGAAFSSTGGLFTETILARQSPVDFKSQLETQLGIAGTESLDAFHPALALMQTFLDPGDPINYAKALQLAPLAAGPHDLLVLEGMQDAVVPLPSIEALAAAAQLPIGGTPLHQSPAFLAAQLGVLPLPVTGNVPLVGGARAGALLQLGGTSDDASVLFNDPVANCQVMKFLKSSLGGAGATIPTCAN